MGFRRWQQWRYYSTYLFFAPDYNVGLILYDEVLPNYRSFCRATGTTVIGSTSARVTVCCTARWSQQLDILTVVFFSPAQRLAVRAAWMEASLLFPTSPIKRLCLGLFQWAEW